MQGVTMTITKKINSENSSFWESVRDAHEKIEGWPSWKRNLKVTEMALPIKSTPKLGVKESEEFLKKLDRDLTKRARMVPTPMLPVAREEIEKHSRKIKRH